MQQLKAETNNIFSHIFLLEVETKLLLETRNDKIKIFDLSY